jgi:hypothetical protein
MPPKFQSYDTQTRLALVEQHLEEQDAKLDKVADKIDSLHSDFSELRLELARKRSSPPEGIAISSRTLKFLAPLAMAFGAGLTTVIKLLIEALAK